MARGQIYVPYTQVANLTYFFLRMTGYYHADIFERFAVLIALLKKKYCGA